MLDILILLAALCLVRMIYLNNVYLKFHGEWPGACLFPGVWILLAGVYFLFIRPSIEKEARPGVTYAYLVITFFVVSIAHIVVNYLIYRPERTIYYKPLLPSKKSLSYVLLDKEGYHDYVAVSLVRNEGFWRAEKKETSGDYGKYVIARKGREKWCLQCVNTVEEVPLKAVEEAVDTIPLYKAAHTVIVTNGVLDPEATRLAKKSDVEVWENYGKQDEK